MGGVEPAFTYALASIHAGKHFVTSNKALVAAKGVELFKGHALVLSSVRIGGNQRGTAGQLQIFSGCRRRLGC